MTLIAGNTYIETATKKRNQRQHIKILLLLESFRIFRYD